MTKLIIEIPDEQDARLLLDFARRLNAVVVQMEEKPADSPIYWLEQLALEGSFHNIDNPVEWQRQTRKERELQR